MSKSQKIAAKYSEYRRGIVRANEHFEIYADVESHSQAHHFTEYEQLMLSYFEWDLDVDPLSKAAAKAYRRRFGSLSYEMFMAKVFDDEPE